jgi:hypothetical protein
MIYLLLRAILIKLTLSIDSIALSLRSCSTLNSVSFVLFLMTSFFDFFSDDTTPLICSLSSGDSYVTQLLQVAPNLEDFKYVYHRSPSDLY